MKSLYSIPAVFFFAITVHSQQKEPIETDRPDQTETPAIVPKSSLQVETGFLFEKVNNQSTNFLTPSTLLKYGVNGQFELRLIVEVINDKTDGKKTSGLSPICIGFKTKLAEESGIIPKTSFIAHLSLPDLASKDLKATYYAPQFRFTMQHKLTDKISLGYNLGAEWDGETPEPVFIYTLTTDISVSAKAGCYLEIYGFAPQKSKADHRFDCGFTYLLTEDFMIDASGGLGITQQAPDYFAAMGFSFRL